MNRNSKGKHFQFQPTKRKIVNASLKLFVRKGYHGTSISDISKAIKLTKGSIYFYFKSKDKLLGMILEEYERKFLDKMIEETVSVNGRTIDKMRHLLRFALNFAAQNKDLCLCLTTLSTELCGGGKKYEKYIKKIYRKYSKFISDLLEEGIKDASFREDINCSILALNLIGTLEGNLLQWTMNRGEVIGELYSRSLAKFFLIGICRNQ